MLGPVPASELAFELVLEPASALVLMLELVTVLAFGPVLVTGPVVVLEPVIGLVTELMLGLAVVI